MFNTDGREIPIVHRIIKVHERASNSSQLDILTKVLRQAGSRGPAGPRPRPGCHAVPPASAQAAPGWAGLPSPP